MRTRSTFRRMIVLLELVILVAALTTSHSIHTQELSPVQRKIYTIVSNTHASPPVLYLREGITTTPLFDILPDCTNSAGVDVQTLPDDETDFRVSQDLHRNKIEVLFTFMTDDSVQITGGDSHGVLFYGDTLIKVETACSSDEGG